LRYGYDVMCLQYRDIRYDAMYRAITRSVCVCVCVCVCALRTRVSCAKISDLIKMPFGGQTHLGPKNFVLDELQILSWEGALVDGTCLTIVTYLCMSAFHIVHLLPLANVPAQHTQWTNTFAAIEGVARRRCCLIPNYFGHLF